MGLSRKQREKMAELALETKIMRSLRNELKVTQSELSEVLGMEGSLEGAPRLTLRTITSVRRQRGITEPLEFT